MKVTYEEIKVHLDLLQGSSIQSKRWMIETYLLLAPAEIALAINTNDDIESLIKEYNSEIETELLHVLSTLMTQCSQSGSYEYLKVTEAKDCPNNHHGDIVQVNETSISNVDSYNSEILCTSDKENSIPNNCSTNEVTSAILKIQNSTNI